MAAQLGGAPTNGTPKRPHGIRRVLSLGWFVRWRPHRRENSAAPPPPHHVQGVIEQRAGGFADDVLSLINANQPQVNEHVAPSQADLADHQYAPAASTKTEQAELSGREASALATMNKEDRSSSFSKAPSAVATVDADDGAATPTEANRETGYSLLSSAVPISTDALPSAALFHACHGCMPATDTQSKCEPSLSMNTPPAATSDDADGWTTKISGTGEEVDSSLSLDGLPTAVSVSKYVMPLSTPVDGNDGAVKTTETKVEERPSSSKNALPSAAPGHADNRPATTADTKAENEMSMSIDVLPRPLSIIDRKAHPNDIDKYPSASIYEANVISTSMSTEVLSRDDSLQVEVNLQVSSANLSAAVVEPLSDEEASRTEPSGRTSKEDHLDASLAPSSTRIESEKRHASGKVRQAHWNAERHQHLTMSELESMNTFTPPGALGADVLESGRVRLRSTLSAQQNEALEAAITVYTQTLGTSDPFVDATVLRFLVAHKWNVAKAHRHLKHTATWRNSPYGSKRGITPAQIRAKFLGGQTPAEVPQVQTLYRVLPFVLEHRRSYTGDLLVIAALGAADVDAFFRLMSYSDWTCANIYHCEWLYLRLDQESFLQGRLVTAVQLYDCQGITLKHVMPRVLWRMKESVLLPDLHYPEFFSAIRAFSIMPLAVKAYEWFRPLLSHALQERIHLIPPKHSDGYCTLFAPPSSIPQCYGGDSNSIPPESAKALGYALVDASMRALWFPGPPTHLGGYSVLQPSCSEQGKSS